MKVQFLISTTNRQDISFLKEMFKNNKLDDIAAIVINQCFKIDVPIIENPYPNIKIFSVNDKGSSRSRYMALDKADGDVVVFSDDDIIYEPEVSNKIIQMHSEHPEADFITFMYGSTNGGVKKRYPKQALKHYWRSVFWLGTLEISIKRERILKLGVQFDTDFGVNARYKTGEDAIFSKDILNNNGIGLFIPTILLRHPDVSSGLEQTSEMCFARGAVFQRLVGNFAPLMGLYFILKNKNKLKENSCGLMLAWRRFMQGRKDYLYRRINKQ